MTEEQKKAKELIDKFLPYMYCYMGSGMLTNDYDLKVATDNAKKSAVLCVLEIMASKPIEPNPEQLESLLGKIESSIQYWNKVIEEINKL